MKELRFDKSYTKNDAKTFIKLPFDMPPGIERIEVEYDYPRFVDEKLPAGICRREVNIADLGIYDEKDSLFGWSGSNQRSIFISSTTASPGYHHGIIKPGKWAIGLGLYKIESTVTISIRVRMYERERRMYRGDLHMHTVNSDGAYTTASVIQYCEQAGLDFIALTDHNNMKQNSEIGNPVNISVIPGMEFTNYRGHANFFFPDRNTAFEGDFLSNTFDEMAALFRKAKAAGAVISLNHAFSECPWEFGYENFPFDLIEVWNGAMRKCNMQTIGFWHSLLCQGKKISIIAGSDTHRYTLGNLYGSPCTMVYADSPAPADLLAGLVAGRSCIAYTPSGPCLELDIDGTGLGGTVPYKPALEVKALVSNVIKGDIVKLINRSGIAETVAIPFNGSYTVTCPVEDCSFYRLELYRSLLGEAILCGLSNPIFIQS